MPVRFSGLFPRVAGCQQNMLAGIDDSAGVQGSRVYVPSRRMDAAGLCWASPKNWFALRRRRIDRYRALGVDCLKLGVSATSRDIRSDVHNRS
jgi:hypothetical protein